MKKQVSPEALLQDVKRDWPRWRTALPNLLTMLENSTNNHTNRAYWFIHLAIKPKQYANRFGNH